MPYEKLLEIVKTMSKGMARFDIVSFFMECQGYVSKEDYHNIQRLYNEGLIDA